MADYDLVGDLAIRQGATWRVPITWYDTYVSAGHEDNEPTDLTGYSAKFQARTHPAGVLVINLEDGDGITLGDDAGTIELLISDEDTAALNFEEARYNLKLTSAGGEDTRLLEGRIVCVPEVVDEGS